MAREFILGVLVLATGIAIGSLVNRWEVQTGGPQMPIVWRLDRLTGQLELCYPGKPPECFAATNPGAS